VFYSFCIVCDSEQIIAEAESLKDLCGRKSGRQYKFGLWIRRKHVTAGPLNAASLPGWEPVATICHAMLLLDCIDAAGSSLIPAGRAEEDYFSAFVSDYFT